MLLAVDVGNTHMVIGLFAEAKLRCHWRVKTDRNSTADELAAVFHGLFALDGLGFGEVSAVIISSVVPVMQAAWSTFARTYLQCQPLVVGENLHPGIEICIDQPGEIGADRLVNAVAAYAEYQGALIVVDFGTAITWDCVSAKGAYLGGAIAPGPAIAIEALSKRTARLPQVDISQPASQPIGTNTVAAIRSGILFGYGGMVDGLINRLALQMGERPHTFATGGMAELIAPYTTSIDRVEPMLTLKGLRLLYEQNR